MTNEEKAKEIGEFFVSPYLAAKEMAEWKDEQFREYLEEVKDCIVQAKRENSNDELLQVIFNNEISHFDTMINTLFK